MRKAFLYYNVLMLNTLRPRQNGRHFADDIFKCIFLNEDVWISIKISLKFVPKGPINNIPALVQIMAWRRPGDKPLSEAMMARLPTHICVTRPQWVNCKMNACWILTNSYIDLDILIEASAGPRIYTIYDHFRGKCLHREVSNNYNIRWNDAQVPASQHWIMFPC